LWSYVLPLQQPCRQGVLLEQETDAERTTALRGIAAGLQECTLGIGMCLEEDSAGRRKHVS